MPMVAGKEGSKAMTMYDLWFSAIDRDGKAVTMHAAIPDLQTIRCIWDALSKDGYYMISKRP